MARLSIPAGKFMMGTPEPESPWIGGTLSIIGGAQRRPLHAVVRQRPTGLATPPTAENPAVCFADSARSATYQRCLRA
jgi:hypothetical protein